MKAPIDNLATADSRDTRIHVACKAPDDRWYKGVRHCVIVSPMSKLKTVKVQWDDGTFDIVPVRMCWRWRKEK